MNDVIIIIPTYNEIENIENIIRKIFSLQRQKPHISIHCMKNTRMQV